MSKLQIKKEIEFKWSIFKAKEFNLFLTAVKEMGLSIKSCGRQNITDYYLVNRNNILYLKQKRTRIRRVGKAWYLTRKTLSKLKRGFVQRIEETKRLPAFENIQNALKYVQKFFLNPPILNVHFVIKNQRARYLLKDRKLLAAVSFDRVRINGKKKTIQMMEIELELLKGNLTDFKNLTRKITRLSSLSPSKRSKVATALHSLFLKK